MAKERIEKTLVVFDEEEVRQILELAHRNVDEEVEYFLLMVFIKRVEAILRRRRS